CGTRASADVHDVLDPHALVVAELDQCRESGRDVSALEPRVQAALANGSAAELEQVLDLLAAAPPRADWEYDEPSTLAAIEAVVPERATDDLGPALDDETVRDRVHAAWLGRCAGCVLGKPVEGWTRETIREYLELENAYPLVDYFPAATGNGFEMRE